MFSHIVNRSSLLMTPETTRGCLSDVLAQLNVLRDCYPNFDHWINSKVLPGIYEGERSILVEYRYDQLAGFAVIKNSEEEKKLCCLRIVEQFQKTHGLGVRLFEKALEELETDKPLLSVAEERLAQFSKIFDYFGFELCHKYDGLYRAGKAEYSFNGILESSHGKLKPKTFERTFEFK